MYRYDDSTGRSSPSASREFRDQVARRLSGELTEDEFKPLRLMNGLYLQLHAYMLRIAIPYGTLSSRQLRKLADIARKLRPRLRPFHHAPEPPVQLDQARGAAGRHGRAGRGRDARHPDLRQLHPQRHRRPLRRRRGRRDRRPAPLGRDRPPVVDAASGILFLPRKFKIAVTGVGARPRRDARSTTSACGCSATTRARSASRSWSAAGSAARRSSPRRSAVPAQARRCWATSRRSCASTTSTAGATTSTRRASRSWCTSSAPRSSPRRSRPNGSSIKDGALALDPAGSPRSPRASRYPAYRAARGQPAGAGAGAHAPIARFDAWVGNIGRQHKVPGYAIVTLSLKPIGGTPGDATAEQMDASPTSPTAIRFDEIRVSHEQNLVLPHVAQRDLPAVWRALDAIGLADAECRADHRHHRLPGPRLLRLANARSIPVAQEISQRFARSRRWRAISAS